MCSLIWNLLFSFSLFFFVFKNLLKLGLQYIVLRKPTYVLHVLQLHKPFVRLFVLNSFYRHTEMFDQFARQLLGRTTHDIILPPEGTVYDIHVDVTLGVLVSWADSNREKMRTVNANFTVTPEVHFFLKYSVPINHDNTWDFYSAIFHFD